MQKILLELLAVIEKWGSAIIPLIAVYLGWRLGYYSERRRRELEILEKKIDALRALREVVDNIPRDIKAEELAERMKTDSEFKENLKHRLVRLFGLRRELIPYLDEKITFLIDKRFMPLFLIETGSYDLKADATDAFAKCCEELTIETDNLEKDLTQSYYKRLR
jgi:hypothetical protein